MSNRTEQPRFRLDIRTVRPGSASPRFVEPANFDDFRRHFGDIDWAEEWATAWWAKAQAPGLAVTDDNRRSTLWVCVHNWMAHVVPGGGSTYRESCEFVIGHAGLVTIGDAKNLRVQQADEVLALFRLYFAGAHEPLCAAMNRFPNTDVYDAPWV